MTDRYSILHDLASLVRVSIDREPEPDARPGSTVVQTREVRRLVSTWITLDLEPDVASIPRTLHGTTDGLAWTATLDRYDGGAASYEITERLTPSRAAGSLSPVVPDRL